MLVNNWELKRIGQTWEEKATSFLAMFVDDYQTWKYHIAHVNNNVYRPIFGLN